MKFPTEIQLQWPVCPDGYRFTEVHPGKEQEESAIKWGRPVDQAPTQIIEACSGALNNYWPLDEHPGLFQTFARLEPSRDAFVAFCNSYGSLVEGPSKLYVVWGFHECLREALKLPVRRKLNKVSPRSLSE